MLAKARLGQDVAGEKQAAAAKKTATVGALVSKYLADSSDTVSTRHHVEISRYLEGYWKPLHALAVDGVRRPDIVRRLDELADEKGRVTADRARGALSAFFAWAIDRGYLDASPVLSIKRRATGGGRSRVLSEDELADVGVHAVTMTMAISSSS